MHLSGYAASTLDLRIHEARNDGMRQLSNSKQRTKKQMTSLHFHQYSSNWRTNRHQQWKVSQMIWSVNGNQTTRWTCPWRIKIYEAWVTKFKLILDRACWSRRHWVPETTFGRIFFGHSRFRSELEQRREAHWPREALRLSTGCPKSLLESEVVGVFHWKGYMV